ncbi:MAG: AEC family transporter [Burkholderiaceae bacterium]
MNSPVVASLVPVVLFIAIGYGVGLRGWIRAGSVKDLSNLVFMVLTPALLFRTMGQVRIEDLDFGPIGVYFAAAGLVFAGTMLRQGFSSLAAARALANTFSNTIMIGVPLVGLAFGQQGLVTLFTLISVHALILLTAATVVFELAVAREKAGQPDHVGLPLWRTVLQAVRNGIVHPVPMPIIAGLLFAQTGLPLPEVIDKPLQLLGQALGPLALLLVGVTLAYTKVGGFFKAALHIALVKNIAMPLVLAALGWALGLSGLSLAVMVVAASLPVGANVFLFAQRYEVAQDEVTASVAVSTALGLATTPVVLWAVTRWVI